MLGGIQAWVAARAIQLALTGAVLAGFGGWLLINNYKQRQIGAQGVLTESRNFGDTANAKSEAIRAKADKPGAASRLRKTSCRDC